MKRICFLAALSVLTMACGSEPTDTPDAGTSVDALLTCESTLAQVTTATIQTDVFQANCVTACHDSRGGASPNLSDATLTQAAVGKTSGYAGSRGTLKMVDTTNLANSALWLKILGGTPGGRRGPNGESVGGRMPPTGAGLSEADKNKVKAWICSGANP